MYLMLCSTSQWLFNFPPYLWTAGSPELGGGAGAGLGTSMTHWAPSPHFHWRLSESIKVKPYHIEKVQPLDKVPYLRHLNWVFLLVELSLQRSLSSQVLVWLCLNIRP